MPVTITLGQRKIIDAARRIIIDHGMEKLTVREIANHLELTDGALYRHFSGKKEIISLLIDDIEESLLSAIDNAAANTYGPLEKLENIFRSHLSYVEKRKGVSFIVINNTLSMKDGDLQNKVFRLVQKYMDRIKTILEEGMVQGIFRRDLDLEDRKSVV